MEYMRDMFQKASSFNQPLNKWDVSNVYYMSSVDLFGGDGGVGREGGQLQCGSRLKPPLSEGRAAAR